MANQKIYIFALAAQGEGISGSDRIFIEFARYWSLKNRLEIFVFEDGHKMCFKQGLDLSKIKFCILTKAGYIARIFKGIKIGLTLKLENNESVIVYSASEFWMDSLPAFILKLRFPRIKWLAAWYQTAPNPLKGFTEDNINHRDRIGAFIYFLVQLPIKLLIKRFAGFVLVNNNNEKKVFPVHDKRGKAVVVLGAVDLERIKKWKKKNKKTEKIFDAVFQGRFHFQKGVLELIDIWKMVVNENKYAKLVMIGDGPLKKNVELRIKNLELSDNIILTGYLFDGEEKYRIFSQSKMVVHPSFYDSGGMASLEAMAFGLPCVGFNLSSFKHYYPKGMIKVKTGNLAGFADKILQLLSDKQLYRMMQKETEALISKDSSWKNRARQILDQVLE